MEKITLPIFINLILAMKMKMKIQIEGLKKIEKSNMLIKSKIKRYNYYNSSLQTSKFKILENRLYKWFKQKNQLKRID